MTDLIRLPHEYSMPIPCAIEFDWGVLHTQRYRYTCWLAWNGEIQQADWTKIAGRELYLHSTDGDIDRSGGAIAKLKGLSFDTEAVNVAGRPEHAAAVATLHAQLHTAWRSWAPRV